MKQISIVGLDLAKSIFHFAGCDKKGVLRKEKVLKRNQVLPFFANLPSSLVGMEACSGAHYWARELQKLGHTVKLIAPQFVKTYRRGNKNDANDAKAIAAAVRQPDMRFVAIKTPEQQDLQALNVQRQQWIQNRTRQAQQIRALLMERGVICPKGIHHLFKLIPEMLGENIPQLSPTTLLLLQDAYHHLQQLTEHIKTCDQALAVINQQTKECQRLQTIPGFGPVVASYFYAYVGDARFFRRGRNVSAALGIVPKQHSSGGKPRLLGISKRGNKQLRSLLIHGARAAVSRAKGKTDSTSMWINKLVERVGIHKATVAYANKMARIGWAVLRYDCNYQPNKAAA